MRGDTVLSYNYIRIYTNVYVLYIFVVYVVTFSAHVGTPVTTPSIFSVMLVPQTTPGWGL